MFRFANIEILWLLLSVPVFVLAYTWYTLRKRRQLRDFGDEELVAQLMPNASKVRPHVKFGLVMLALVMLIIAAARPQYGVKGETVTREGVEAVIALDISNSMLAEDVSSGQVSRLDAGKQMLAQLMDQMVDDKVGMVVFAGDAFVQLPITCDYVSAKMFLNSIQPELIKTQGTAIGKALQISMYAFGEEESAAGRAIILLTDGENFEDDAVEMAAKADKAGIKVIVVGIGSPDGSPIPVPGTTEYKKDRDGEVVVSHLNEEMCREIAKAGNGMYVHYDSSNMALKAIKKELDKLGKEKLESHVFREFNEQYPSFVLIALILLVVDFFVFNRKNKSLTRLNIFKEKKA